ncbi:Ctr copper transporter family-domain-containing protein [Diplogelasinospora grovesii]|uniref:Copper transport protein n=1 Tax=Diplogelasinospora grovesii TaxID=303347 RepID=A0AAN6S300_9PEZI|nr:Ctr copper transporter family-domain-containing protein [Diplogelasinospora grovesii]
MDMISTATSTVIMSMPSPTSVSTSSSMADMPDTQGMGMKMGMSDMAMTFFNSLTTPLFVSSWEPTTAGAYAATCLFLIFLGVLGRLLIAIKPVLEETVWSRRRASSVRIDRAVAADSGEPKFLPVRTSSLEYHGVEAGDEAVADARTATEATKRRVGEIFRAARSRRLATTFGSRLGRAVYEVVLVGVGYLLMLAVMTMNVGYFMSVLGGVFVGTFLLGSLANNNDQGEGQLHQC